MLRKHGRGAATAAALAFSALLAGCGSRWPAFTTPADAGPGPNAFASAAGPHGGEAGVRSYTIERIRGASGASMVEEPLRVEPGNVWPAEDTMEGPRATLANPDAALRGVPSYRPGDATRGDDGRGRDSGPRDYVPRDERLPPDEGRPPPRRRGASSPPPPPLAQQSPDRLEVLPVPPGGNAPPPRRADGQTVLTPYGAVVTSGGTDRVQGFNTPGGGGGIITRDGGFTTISPSGGIPQTFPTPR